MLRPSVIVVLLAYSALFIFSGTRDVEAAPKDAVAASANITVTASTSNNTQNAAQSIKDKVVVAITDRLIKLEKLLSSISKSLFAPLKLISNSLFNSTRVVKTLEGGKVNVSFSDPVAIKIPDGLLLLKAAAVSAVSGNATAKKAA